MTNISIKRERKDFYKISLYMLGYYITLFLISGIVSILNYYGSKIGVYTAPYRYTSMILSTTSSLLVIVFWFVGRKQQDGLDIVMNKKVAWVLNVIVDLFELAYICLSTIASLYNGNVIKAEFTQLMPIISLLLMTISTFDFIFALTCVLLAKKKIKTK